MIILFLVAFLIVFGTGYLAGWSAELSYHGQEGSRILYLLAFVIVFGIGYLTGWVAANSQRDQVRANLIAQILHLKKVANEYGFFRRAIAEFAKAPDKFDENFITMKLSEPSYLEGEPPPEFPFL